MTAQPVTACNQLPPHARLGIALRIYAADLLSEAGRCMDGEPSDRTIASIRDAFGKLKAAIETYDAIAERSASQ